MMNLRDGVTLEADLAFPRPDSPPVVLVRGSGSSRHGASTGAVSALIAAARQVRPSVRSNPTADGSTRPEPSLMGSARRCSSSGSSTRRS